MIFFKEENYLFFLRKVRKELSPCCEVLAYCLMPNHFHLMIVAKDPDIGQNKTLNSGISILLRSYTRAIQLQENFKGSLFQQKTKSKELNKDCEYGINHPAVCMHYIHQNPLKAGLVRRLEDWEYSSFKDYAGLRNGTLCNLELGFQLTGIQKEYLIKESYDVIVDLNL